MTSTQRRETKYKQTFHFLLVILVKRSRRGTAFIHMSKTTDNVRSLSDIQPGLASQAPGLGELSMYVLT
jgi:hypothetical protein